MPDVRSFGLRAPARGRYPLAVVRLARILRRHNITVLQTHLFDGGMVGLIAGRLARAPLIIVTRHHVDEHQFSRLPVHVAIDRWSARLADRVIVPSAAVRTHMIEAEGLRSVDIAVVPLSVDLDEFSPTATTRVRMRRLFGLGDAFVVGFAGRIVPEKGLERLLSAASAIRQDIPDLRILVLGPQPRPDYTHHLESEIVRLGLEAHVMFGGFRTDMAACMQALDVLVHPSRMEAFGQVILEALAVGTPVVAAAVGGVPEILDSGLCGLLTPAGDSASLACALLKLYRDEDLRRRLAANGRARARKFNVDDMVERHLQQYRLGLGVATGHD